MAQLDVRGKNTGKSEENKGNCLALLISTRDGLQLLLHASPRLHGFPQLPKQRE